MEPLVGSIHFQPAQAGHLLVSGKHVMFTDTPETQLGKPPTPLLLGFPNTPVHFFVCSNKETEPKKTPQLHAQIAAYL